MYSHDYYGGDAPPNASRQQQQRFRSNYGQQYAEGNQDLNDADQSPSPSAGRNFTSNGTAAAQSVNNTFKEMKLIDRVQTQLEMDGRDEHARQSIFSDQYRHLVKDPSRSRRHDLLDILHKTMPSEDERQFFFAGQQAAPSPHEFDDNVYEEIPATNLRQKFNFPRPPSSVAGAAALPPLLASRRGGGTMTLPHQHVPHGVTTPNVYSSMADGDYQHSMSNLSFAGGGGPTPSGIQRPKYPTISATYRKQQFSHLNGPTMPSSSSSSAASAGATNMRLAGGRESSADYAPLVSSNNTMSRPPLLAFRGRMAPSTSYQQLPNPSNSMLFPHAAAAASQQNTLPRSTSHAQFVGHQILSPHVEEEDDDAVTDWDLIKDLVKVCNGINGQYVMLTDTKCELYAHVRINPSYAQIGLKIAEVGWLTHQIRTFIERRRDRGYVKEGLYAGIHERLASLESDIVALDSQLHVEDQESFPACERLTLSRLYALMIEPVKRLGVMFTVAKHVDALKGSEIINYLYTQADEGDRDKRTTAVGLLSACVKPVFFMISHWLYHGQVRDECGEFFIRSIAPERRPTPPETAANADMSFNTTTNSSFTSSGNDTLPTFMTPTDTESYLVRNMQPQAAATHKPTQHPPMATTWYEQFMLLDEQVPKFIPAAMAYKIFTAVQTTCFLRTFCGERAIPDFDKEIMPLLLEIASTAPPAENNLAGADAESERQKLMSGSTATYSYLTRLWNPNTLRLDVRANTIFNRMHNIASRALMDTLNKEFHLSWHIEALVNYMLHKRGDFVVELIELLRNDLERDASTFTTSSDIHGAVTRAVEQSSARTDPEEVLANLSGDFDKKVSDSDVGWDLFSIRYRIDDVGPLQIIFTPDIMLRLRKMWRFIWRVKRADYLLSKLWWNAQTVFGKHQHRSRHSSGAANVLDMTAAHVTLERLIVTEMLHFVQQLEHYICFEVVVVSHAQLLESLGKAMELKDLITAVELFVTKLEERLFLKSFDETVSVRIRSILTCVNAVQRCHESLVLLVAPHAAGLMDYSINNFTMHEQHNLSTADADADEVWTVYNELRQTYLKFQTLTCEFLNGLLSINDDKMQALHFRLDYSHYYERLQNTNYGNELQSYLDIPLQQPHFRHQRLGSGQSA